MITVQRVDITTLDVDAIVNAAGPSLRGGGGVDGAIHRAAGPQLLKACIAVGPCEPGDARITAGFRLPARMVIHAVGPRWCYRRSMQLAQEHNIRSLAFPAISCGVYGYPAAEGAAIAMREVRSALEAESSIRDVIFACPDQGVSAAFEGALG